MRILAVATLIALLSGCAAPHFVADAPPVPVTKQIPDHFELPARFAVARIVYGRIQLAGAEEEALWSALAKKSARLGSFTPLIFTPSIALSRGGWLVTEAELIEVARQQRYNYLLVVRMYPETGSADVALLDVGSGGTMVTAQAVEPSGGQRGFWGGEIGNPARLERVTLRIAKATIPTVEEVLLGVATRQR